MSVKEDWDKIHALIPKGVWIRVSKEIYDEISERSIKHVQCDNGSIKLIA